MEKRKKKMCLSIIDLIFVIFFFMYFIIKNEGGTYVKNKSYSVTKTQ